MSRSMRDNVPPPPKECKDVLKELPEHPPSRQCYCSECRDYWSDIHNLLFEGKNNA